MLGSKEWLQSKDRISFLWWDELVIKKEKKKLRRQWDHEPRIWRRYLGWNQECFSILYPALRLDEKLSSKNWVLGTQYLNLGRLGEPTKYIYSGTGARSRCLEDRWELFLKQCAAGMVLWVTAHSFISRNPSSRTECIPKALWLLERSCSWKHKHTMCGLERWLSSQECWLLFQRTQVRFPAPTLHSSHLPITPVPGD